MPCVLAKTYNWQVNASVSCFLQKCQWIRKISCPACGVKGVGKTESLFSSSQGAGLCCSSGGTFCHPVSLVCLPYPSVFVGMLGDAELVQQGTAKKDK